MIDIQAIKAKYCRPKKANQAYLRHLQATDYDAYLRYRIQEYEGKVKKLNQDIYNIDQQNKVLYVGPPRERNRPYRLISERMRRKAQICAKRMKEVGEYKGMLARLYQEEED